MRDSILRFLTPNIIIFSYNSFIVFNCFSNGDVFDLLQADSGMFLMYDKNSEIWIKLKYSF